MPYLDTSTGQPFIIIPIQVDNSQQGHSYGVELAADWFVSTDWKLKAAYTFFQLELDTRWLPAFNPKRDLAPPPGVA